MLNGSFCSAASRNKFSAVSPSAAASNLQPQLLSIVVITVRFVALTSTTRIREVVISARFKNSGGSERSDVCLSNRAVNQNVEPFPTSLSMPISPPINSASCLEMESPRPVPPYLRVVEPSAWVNGVKMAARRSSGIPMPVSRTEKRIMTDSASSDSVSALITTSPSWVNFMALPARLVIIWRILPGSPFNFDGTSGSILQISSRPASAARIASSSAVSSTVVLKSKSIISMLSFPASILEKSRMSLISSKRFSPLLRTISANWSCSPFRSVSSKRLVKPITPFIGVRISWLMLARKVLLAMLADSAASFASCNSSSNRLRSEISLTVAVIPMISSLTFSKGELRSEAHPDFPVAGMVNGKSTTSHTSPDRTHSRRSIIPSACRKGKISDGCLPRTSSEGMPVRFSINGFHTRYRKSRS